MAQAAKQLKKIKDIEAQALQEQKEKEESNRKRRNRSRDRKKKVRGRRRRQTSGRGSLEVAAGGRRSADQDRGGGAGAREPAELMPPESGGRGAGEEERRGRGFGAARRGQGRRLKGQSGRLGGGGRAEADPPAFRGDLSAPWTDAGRPAPLWEELFRLPGGGRVVWAAPLQLTASLAFQGSWFG